MNVFGMAAWNHVDIDDGVTIECSTSTISTAKDLADIRTGNDVHLGLSIGGKGFLFRRSIIDSP